MWKMKTVGAVALTLAAALTGGACSEDSTRTIVEVQKRDTVTVTVRDTVRVGNTNLVFNQIERLGNPLVNEVMIERARHGLHNSTNPATDVANFRNDLIRFMRNVAGRDQAYAEAVAGALLPDMLAVFPNRAPGVSALGSDESELVGWLSHALQPNNTGYGGRKLDRDDAVDKGLSVIFGAALGNTSNNSPGLVTDNVSDPQQDPNTFPYVAAPFP